MNLNYRKIFSHYNEGALLQNSSVWLLSRKPCVCEIWCPNSQLILFIYISSHPHWCPQKMDRISEALGVSGMKCKINMTKMSRLCVYLAFLGTGSDLRKAEGRHDSRFFVVSFRALLQCRIILEHRKRHVSSTSFILRTSIRYYTRFIWIDA